MADGRCLTATALSGAQSVGSGSGHCDDSSVSGNPKGSRSDPELLKAARAADGCARASGASALRALRHQVPVARDSSNWCHDAWGMRARACESVLPSTPKGPHIRAFRDAPKRTRTSTGESPHKALNLARLPIPPPAQGQRSIGRLIPSAGLASLCEQMFAFENTSPRLIKELLSWT